MLHIIKSVAIALLLSTSMGAMANTVAIWNSQIAISNSNYAKSKVASMQASIKPKEQQLKTYQDNIKKLQDQYEQQKEKITDTQKEALRKQMQTNVDNYTQVAAQIQAIIEQNERDVLQKISAKMPEIQNSITKQKNIDILIDSRDRNISFVKPEWDVTKDFTQKINELVK